MAEVRDPLADLLAALEDPEFQAGLQKLVQLVKNLERSGLLDAMIALTDEDAMSRLVQILLTTGTLQILDSIDRLADTAGAVVKALEEPVEPVSLTGLLASLRDPEVARGLARMLRVLKAIGAQP